MKDYYKILDLKPDATEEDAKKSYRELAKKYHPDINKEPGADAKFKEVSEAYDAVKSGWRPGQRRQSHGPSGFPFPGQNPLDFFFQNNPIFNQPIDEVYISPDIELIIELDFLDACHGLERMMRYNVKELCSECKDFFSKNGKFDSKKCDDCNGLGKVTQRSAFMSVTTGCRKCNGTGKIVNCSKCNGTMYEAVEKTISVKIPEGIDTNSKLRVSNAGNYFHKEKRNGDLYLNINIRPHPIFKRKDMDIFSEINLDYLDCLLGAEIEVDTIYGKHKLEIPDLSENKRIIMLKNYGIKKMGTHYFTINMTIPKSISKKERKSLQSIKKIRKN